MVQQGRLVAAALGDRDRVMTDDAVALLWRLGRRGDGRIRVYDTAGVLLADSVRAPDRQPRTGRRRGCRRLRERLWHPRARPLSGGRLDRSGAAGAPVARTRNADPVRRVASASGGPRSDDARSDQEALLGPEVRAALEGRYGTAIRPTPGQRSLTLYSAVPIRHGDRVVGAALVSQSTFRILQALYDVRLRIFQIVIASFGAAVIIGLMMSATIVRPLVRLRRAAMALSDRRATPASFGRVDRKDEIGDLARTLEELTSRLDAHIRLLESFAGDVSHEFKNPLAAIRVAAEAIAATDDPVERQRLLGMLTRDVDRLERLVTGVRELARIDAQLAHEEIAPVDVSALLEGLVEAFRQRDSHVRLVYAGPSTRVLVRASPDRLAQIFENLLDNAASFAPRGSVVDVVMAVDGPACSVRVEDRGSGFPPGHVERIFDRFFSYRPDDGGRREHMGLGLSIARAIVEGYGGTIAAVNRSGGGASVEVRLPALTGPRTAA